MNKWYEVTFKVFNSNVWKITVQVRHAYDPDYAESIARAIVKNLTIMETVSVVEIRDQVSPAPIMVK